MISIDRSRGSVPDSLRSERTDKVRAAALPSMGSSTQKTTISSYWLYFLHTSHFKPHRLLPHTTGCM
jgi:hypothetical protein